MKTKRVWTDEQRRAASERMRTMQANRKVNTIVKEIEEEILAPTEKVEFVKERPPEVQAILDSMPEDRKAKLAAVQARTMANLSQTQEGREALERLEARHNGEDRIGLISGGPPMPIDEAVKAILEALPPAKKLTEVPYRVPFRLTGSQSGMMVSEFGPCVCGEAKLKWHPVCLRVKAYV